MAASLTITSASLAADGRSLIIYVGGIGTGPLLPASGAVGFTVTNTTAGWTQKVMGATAGASTVTALLAYQVSSGDVVTLSYAPGTLTDSAATANTMPALGPVSVTSVSTAVAANLTQIASGNFATVPGLRGWFRADAGVFTDAAKATAASADGDLVYTWADQSGRGNDAVQATAGSRPTLKLAGNGIGGKPTLHMSGATFTAGGVWTAAMNTSSTIVSVARVNTNVNNNFFYSSSGYYVGGGYSTPSRSSQVPDPSANSISTSQGKYAVLDFPTFESTQVMDGDTLLTTANKTALSYGNSALSGVAGNLTLGAYSGGGFNFNGEMSEMLFSDQALTPTVRKAVEEALIVKYSIAIASLAASEGDSIEGGLFGAGITALPAGFVGFDTSQAGRLVSDMAANVSTRIVSLFDPKRPRTIAVLFGGTNDINGATSGNQAATTSAVLTNITAWTKAVRAAGGRAIVGTLLPRSTSSTDPVEIARLSINSSLRAAPSTYGIDALADMGNDLTMGQTSQAGPSAYYADGVHPAVPGYTLAGRYFAQAFSTLDNGLLQGKLTFGTPTQTSVVVSWPAATGGTGPYTYQLQRSADASGGPGTFANVGTAGTALTLTDTGLTSGATYWYQVKAVDTSAALATPTAVPTIAPTGGSATGGLLTAGTYLLKYTINNSSGESLPSPESASFTLAAANTPQVTLPAVGAGQWLNLYLTQVGGATNTETRHLHAVRFTTQNLTLPNQASGAAVLPSSNTTGVLANYSPALSAQMATTAPLSAPAPTFSSVTTTAITVSWGAASGGTAPYTYQLQRSPDNATWANVAGATTSPATNTGLTAGTTYYYRISVIDNVAATASSTSASQVTSNALTQTTISVSAHTSTTASLSSTAATGGTAPYTYQWYRSSVSSVFDYSGAANQVAGATALTLTDTGLAPGTTYYYLLKATDAAATSAQSTVLTQMTVVAAPSATVFAASGVVALSWPAVLGALSYTVLRGGTAIATGLTTLYYVDTGLTQGASYTYTLTTAGTNGDISAPSAGQAIVADVTSGLRRRIN